MILGNILPNQKKLAVLIDADNIGASAVGDIFRLVSQRGAPIVRRAYGTPARFQGTGGWQLAQREYGISSKPQVSNLKGKNAADIALVIDAMECLYTLPCDGICIVSSDSDYTALAVKIRESGKAVFGLGDEKAPISFKSACTEYIVLPKIKKAQPTAKADPVCPRCGEKLTQGWTKSRKACHLCPSCGGMSSKISLLKKNFEEASIAEIVNQAKQHAQSGCVCPDCGSSMTLVRVAAGNKKVIEIDVCGHCQSVWYDKDEFESLIPTDGLLHATISAGKTFRREVVTLLTSDLRSGRIKAASVGQLKTAIKGLYHAPQQDIEAIVGALQCQRVILVAENGSMTLRS